MLLIAVSMFDERAEAPPVDSARLDAADAAGEVVSSDRPPPARLPHEDGRASS